MIDYLSKRIKLIKGGYDPKGFFIGTFIIDIVIMLFLLITLVSLIVGYRMGGEKVLLLHVIFDADTTLGDYIEALGFNVLYNRKVFGAFFILINFYIFYIIQFYGNKVYVIEKHVVLNRIISAIALVASITRLVPSDIEDLFTGIGEFNIIFFIINFFSNIICFSFLIYWFVICIICKKKRDPKYKAWEGDLIHYYSYTFIFSSPINWLFVYLFVAPVFLYSSNVLFLIFINIGLLVFFSMLSWPDEDGNMYEKRKNKSRKNTTFSNRTYSTNVSGNNYNYSNSYSNGNGSNNVDSENREYEKMRIQIEIEKHQKLVEQYNMQIDIKNNKIKDTQKNLDNFLRGTDYSGITNAEVPKATIASLTKDIDNLKRQREHEIQEIERLKREL